MLAQGLMQLCCLLPKHLATAPRFREMTFLSQMSKIGGRESVLGREPECRLMAIVGNCRRSGISFIPVMKSGHSISLATNTFHVRLIERGLKPLQRHKVLGFSHGVSSLHRITSSKSLRTVILDAFFRFIPLHLPAFLRALPPSAPPRTALGLPSRTNNTVGGVR